jgi:hypothetical protein
MLFTLYNTLKSHGNQLIFVLSTTAISTSTNSQEDAEADGGLLPQDFNTTREGSAVCTPIDTIGQEVDPTITLATSDIDQQLTLVTPVTSVVLDTSTTLPPVSVPSVASLTNQAISDIDQQLTSVTSVTSVVLDTSSAQLQQPVSVPSVAILADQATSDIDQQLTSVTSDLAQPPVPVPSIAILAEQPQPSAASDTSTEGPALMLVPHATTADHDEGVAPGVGNVTTIAQDKKMRGTKRVLADGAMNVELSKKRKRCVSFLPTSVIVLNLLC